MAVTRWWLLRHAPVLAPAGLVTGRLDLDCDVSDSETFRRLAICLPRDAVLVESGLKRCRRTAEALAEAGLPLPPPLVEPNLAEQHFGAWQGRCWNDIEAGDFWDDAAGNRPPGGESFADLAARVAQAIAELTRTHQGRDIIAVVHAGTVRAALALALGSTPAQALAFEVAPLSLTRLDHGEDGWSVAEAKA